MDDKLSIKEKSDIPLHFILSLSAGIIILFSGFVLPIWHVAVFPHFEMMMGSAQLLGQSAMIASISIIVTGIVIIAMAIVMYKQPSQVGILGLVILFFSVLSILEMGGFIIGGIIGIVDGSLASRRKTRQTHSDVKK